MGAYFINTHTIIRQIEWMAIDSNIELMSKCYNDLS